MMLKYKRELAQTNSCGMVAHLEISGDENMNLLKAEEGKEYIISSIETDDEELDAFLFSLGCYSGEPITVISHLKGGCIVSIKDGRYSIDKALAAAIAVNG
jgi:ferrous iron transport protein A